MATIKTWSDYLEVVQQHAGATNVFRGENKDSFELKPSVGRERASKRSHSEIMEKQLLENFSQKIALLVETNRLDDWDTMAFAQHVGVPTRLLDWSLSPLVALFFALEGDHKSDRVVYAYKIKSFVDDSARSRSPFSAPGARTFIPKQFHPRFKSQRAVFTVHSDPTKHFSSNNLERHIIAAECVAFLKRSLFKMGVDYWHIYPDAEGIGRQLKWQFNHGVPSTG
jgi:hypothetical protein